jgi:hypothetical protein
LGTEEWGSPLVKAYAANLGYPILFLAHEEGNLAGERCAQLGDWARLRRSIFLGFFHVGDGCCSLLKIAVLAASVPLISRLTRGIGNK